MKKILLVTTALVATASVASADVTTSGSARFGVQYLSTDGTPATAGVGTAAAATAATAAHAASVTAMVGLRAANTAAAAVVTANSATGTLTAANVTAATAAQAALDAGQVTLDADTVARNLLAGTPATAGTSTTSLESRVTLNIDFSTETDGGLVLGGRLRFRANENSVTDTNGAQLYVKSGGFKLTVGNICGAIECMPGVYAGSMGLNGHNYANLVTNTRGAGWWGWDAYSSSGIGANGAEVEYTAGDFKAHLSYGNLNAAAFHRVALTLAYTFGDWTAALGLQEGDQAGGVDDKTILTVNGKLGDFGVGFAVADNNGTVKYALNGSYTMGATTISGYVADEDTAGIDSSYGLTVAYDLGGATLVGGVSSAGDAFGGSNTRATAGIKFKF